MDWQLLVSSDLTPAANVAVNNARSRNEKFFAADDDNDADVVVKSPLCPSVILKCRRLTVCVDDGMLQYGAGE